MEIVREFISTVFVVKNAKVLMTWNKKVSNWIPIGGHIEQNELPCNSVIREAKEESGLDIELIHPSSKAETANLVQPIHVHLDHIKEDHKHINLIYFGTVKGGECFEIDDEGKELKWFSKEDLEKESLLPNVKEWATEALKHLGDKY
ncbi:MAG: NUDIX domain-containing protein [Candidatus ainarchaeum sp.]|nr:NUDIX domain-containing protein [Candidatus ainarchaeum sp.]